MYLRGQQVSILNYATLRKKLPTLVNSSSQNLYGVLYSYYIMDCWYSLKFAILPFCLARHLVSSVKIAADRSQESMHFLLTCFLAGGGYWPLV